MKITENRLRQIIREEMQTLLEYEEILLRKNGKTYRVNDEGEEDYVDSDPESHGLYNDGDSKPIERGSSYGGGRDSYSGAGRYGRNDPGEAWWRGGGQRRRRY